MIILSTAFLNGPLPLLAFFGFIISIGYLFQPADPERKKKEAKTIRELQSQVRELERKLERANARIADLIQGRATGVYEEDGKAEEWKVETENVKNDKIPVKEKYITKKID